jgi:hypothetical protein
MSASRVAIKVSARGRTVFPLLAIASGSYSTGRGSKAPLDGPCRRLYGPEPSRDR